jgi:S1-C subfamily serine protease
VITEVTENGPAEKAGLQRTDVIVGINNRPVSSLEDLRLIIAQSIPGSSVVLQLIRDGKEKSVEVTLGELSEIVNQLLPGVDASPLSDEARGRLGLDSRVTGLVVTEVSEDSPYTGYLVPNIVIVEINRSAVTDITSARDLFRVGRNLLLVYYRGQYRYLTVSVK